MLFLVVSTPRPDRPSAVVALRRKYWTWMNPLLKSGMARWVYARVGRGAVALFDVDGNNALHRLINEWSEIIPAHFDVYPLLDPATAQRYLKSSTRDSRHKR
jgi:muconolactone delta-isomerase